MKKLNFVFVIILVLFLAAGCAEKEMTNTLTKAVNATGEETVLKTTIDGEEDINAIRKIIPNVIDMHVDDAIKVLKEKGFVVRTEKQEIPAYTAVDCVAEQSIESGNSIPKGKEILITIAKESIIPYDDEGLIIGNYRGKVYTEIKKILNDEGVQVIKEYKYGIETDEGRVLEQSITSGQKLYSGETIRLTVGAGEEPLIIPDFRGLPFEAALESAKDMGIILRPMYEVDDGEKDEILRQAIAPKSEILKGKEISVFISFNNNETFHVGHSGEIAYINSDSTMTIVDANGNEITHYKSDELSDVVGISLGAYHAVALKEDGTLGNTVVFERNEYYRQTDFEEWAGIVQVAAGGNYTVGLLSNGRAVATTFTPDNRNSRTRRRNYVEQWENLVKVSAGLNHTVGLKRDGTCYSVGDTRGNKCTVANWRDIVDICAGEYHTLGLRADGTVICTGFLAPAVRDWKNIIAIDVGKNFVVGMDADGNVMYAQQSGRKMVEGYSKISGKVVEISAGGNVIAGQTPSGEIIIDYIY